MNKMPETRIESRLLGKTILVAEDVELNQHLTRHILEAFGAAVIIANNGSEALNYLTQRNFDCILMDVQMPEMDGVEATRRIRRLDDPVKSGIPIIALTANTQPEDLERYRYAGMDDYLSKPFDDKQLLEAILRRPAEMEEEIPEVAATKLYDLTMIRSVSGGDPAFLKKMVLLFIETVPQNVRELVESGNSSNWEQVARMAHKLKSTVDSMGIRSLRADIRTVEANAKTKTELDLMPAMISRIDQVIADCIVQLRTEIA